MVRAFAFVALAALVALLPGPSFAQSGDAKPVGLRPQMDAARAVLAQAGADAISIFDTLDKQLGLKLEMRKRSRPVLVIDHVEEKPTD
jgi:uncharacterized protein (TIGR03435 family)